MRFLSHRQSVDPRANYPLTLPASADAGLGFRIYKFRV